MAGTEPVLPLGSTLDGYRVERVLGSGSYGTVYLAVELNPRLARTVALKVLRPTLGADDGFRERFFRESRLVARLEPHPAIVSVYDAGEEQGLLWIASRFVDGTDLRGALTTYGRIGPDLAGSLIEQVASGLDIAHAEGIVHRDVKPANLLLSKDLKRAFLADFGISKSMSKSMESDVDNSLTQVGQFVGTVKYAAPEQFGGGDITGRSDQYSLACVAYETLTGQPPFQGDMRTIMYAHAAKPLPDIRAVAPELPPHVNDVIQKAAAKRPEARYPTCTAFATDLVAALRRSADQTHLDPPRPRLPEPPERRPEPGGPQDPPRTPGTAASSPPPGSSGFSGAHAPPGTPQGARPPPSTPQPGHPGPVGPMPTPHDGLGSTPGPGAEMPPRGRSTAALVGIIAAIAVPLVAVATVLGLCLTGDGCPWSSPAPFPTEAEQRLLDVLPAAIRHRCERDIEVAGDEPMGVAVRCQPGDDRVDAVAFRQVADRAGLDAAFASAIRNTPVVISDDTDCVRHHGATNDYTTADNLFGRIACYRDGGSSYLVWTTDELRILGEAHQEDRFDADLYDWWAELLEVVVQDDTQDAALLRTYVPSPVEVFCEPFDTGGATLASLVCEPDGLPADFVSYDFYPTVEALRTAYDELRIDYGLPEDLTAFCPTEDEWTEDEALSPGRLACAFNDELGTLLFWTDERLNVLAFAARFDGDADLLRDWWRDNGAGPLVP